MLDGLHDNPRLVVVGVVCLTIIVWFAVRRCAARGKACRVRYCPRCGLDIAARMSGRSAVPQARPASVCVETPRAAASDALPSQLLRCGWSRTVQPAADAAGRPVFPDNPDARYFTLWAAGNRAFVPGSPRWRSFFENLQTILQRRYGEITMQKWNRSAPNQATVIAVAEEAQRMMLQDGE